MTWTRSALPWACSSLMLVWSASACTNPDAGLELEVEVRTHAGQPMVVDLAFSAPDLDIAAAHLGDAGVVIRPLEDPDDSRTWLRLRGLAPDTLHAIEWSAHSADGRTQQGSTELMSAPALPGFEASFPVEGAGLEGYLMFDLLRLGQDQPASLFVLDAQGQTRWHISQNAPTVGPSIIYAGAKLRADGSVSYLHDYSIWIVDELGREQLRISSEQLGVVGLHHDLIELDSGNFLTMSYVFEEVDYPNIGPTMVAGDLLLELTPAGEIVWQWSTFDYLDALRVLPGFQEIITDPLTGVEANDLTHGNGMVYEPETDTVLVSLRHQDWLIRVDRQTDELVWRLGPEGDFELDSGEWFYHQHSPEWQADGSLLLYDNGWANPNVEIEQQRSRAVRYAFDFDAMKVTQVWQDDPAADPILAPIAGDADRLDDGSLLITDSSIGMVDEMIYARVRKVDEADSLEPLWSFTTTVGTFIYRCVASAKLPGM